MFVYAIPGVYVCVCLSVSMLPCYFETQEQDESEEMMEWPEKQLNLKLEQKPSLPVLHPPTVVRAPVRTG